MTVLIALMSIAASAASAQVAPTPTPKAESASDKVDLKALEDKYWAAKDEDLGVVQNRTFTKANRFYASVGLGPLINDEWMVGTVNHFSAGYFFTEHWGLELSYQKGALHKNDGIDFIVNRNGLQPDHNVFNNALTLYGSWVPFYGKMSLVDSKIIYFDMQFSAGIGQVSYDQQIDPAEGGNKTLTTPAVSLDITQQFFFSNHLAVRVDLKNRWSTQQRRTWRFSGSSSPTADLGNKSQQDTTLQVGLTFFY